jgi:hypothetical protein
LIKKSRSYTKLILIGLFLSALFAGGCGGGSGKTAGETPEMPSVAMRKVAVLGEPSEELRQFLASDGIQIETFDENNPTAYPTVVITGEKLTELETTADNVRTDDIIRAIFDSDTDKVGHILLFRPDNSDIKKLEELLGESFGMEAIDGVPLLYYALHKDEDDGFVRVLAQLDSSTAKDIIEVVTGGGEGQGSEESEPGGSGGADEAEVTPAGGLSRDGLANWLDGGYENKGRKSVSRGANGDRVNLVDFAKSYRATLLFYPWDQIGGVDGANRKSIQTNVFVTAVHEFGDTNDAAAGRDWYYIKEDNLFDGSDGYHKAYQGAGYTCKVNGTWYPINGAEVADQFFKEIELNHYLLPLYSYGQSINDIVLTQADPQAINNESTNTIGTSWGISPSVGAGFEGGTKGIAGKAEGTLGFNVGFSDSTSFKTQDVSVQMRYTASAKEPGWVYKYKMPERTSSILYRLNNPAELSHSVYSPKQSWIWGIPTKLRNINSFRITVKAIRAAVLLTFSGSRPITEVTGKSNYYDNTNIDKLPGVTIKLPQPPILALEENNFVFGRQESTKATKIMGQGGWKVSEIKVSENGENGGNWVTATPTDNRLDIGVSSNDTGKNREAVIVIKRLEKDSTGTTVETKDEAKITVTQLSTLTSN